MPRGDFDVIPGPPAPSRPIPPASLPGGPQPTGSTTERPPRPHNPERAVQRHPDD